MSDQDKDKDGNPVNEPNPSDSPELTSEDLLKTIKAGDGRQKYASTSDALKSIAPAQEHITKVESDNASLKEENAQMKAELDKRETIEDTVAKMLAKRQPETEEPSAPALDGDRLNEAISASIEKRDRTKLEDANAEAVVATLTKQLGTAQAASDKMANTAKELGLDVQELYLMSKTSPASVYKLLGVDPATVEPSPVTKQKGTINPLTLKGEPAPEKVNVMRIGSTTKDLLTAWRAAKPKT